MRIAMISEHASPLTDRGAVAVDGQGAQVAELSAALAEQGHEVRVYTRRDSPELPATVGLGEHVDVVHVPAGPATPVSGDDVLPYLGDFGQWLIRDWRDGDWMPTVAHAHFWTSGLAAVTAARQCRIPVVQSFHALGSRDAPHLAGDAPSPRVGYERTLGRVVDRVIVQGQDEVSELVRLGVPRAQLALVQSGVNADLFAPDGPAAPGTADRPRILAVSRHLDRAGLGDVVQAMRYVPTAECVVVGGPSAADLATDPGARLLRELAVRHQVDDRVTLVGAVPYADMPRWYRSADLVVAARWHEPFGLTPLEAMACGVPVVGSASGGLTDAVVDGLTGDLVPPRDPRALGAALRRLVNDRVRRFAYATAALDRARQCYSWRRAAAQLGSVYAAVAGLRRPADPGDTPATGDPTEVSEAMA